ncbi:hypothetical protein RYX36_021693 [Vicia faba]
MALEAFKLQGFELQWHFAIVLGAAFLFVVAVFVLLKLFISNSFGDLQAAHAAGDCGQLTLREPAYGGSGDGGFVAGSFTNILGSGGSGSDRAAAGRPESGCSGSGGIN